MPNTTVSAAGGALPAASHEPEAEAPATILDAMDELHHARHLAGLIRLAGEGLAGSYREAAEAIVAGVAALSDKLEAVDAILEALHEREREGEA